jgi:hypothetical protein
LNGNAKNLHKPINRLSVRNVLIGQENKNKSEMQGHGYQQALTMDVITEITNDIRQHA